MRPRPATRALASLLIAGSALSWLSLAGPAAASGNPSASAGAAAASAGASAGASAAPSAAAQTPCGTLCVERLSVDSSGYPNVTVNLSIYDKDTGKPVIAPERNLDKNSFSLSPAGQVTAVGGGVLTPQEPALLGKYVLDIDTSGSMHETWRMARAKALAVAFVNGLGPNDSVKLLTFAADTYDMGPWMNAHSKDLADAINKIQAPEQAVTNLSAAVKKAAGWANASDGPAIDRREVVIITDADAQDNDLPKSPQELGNALSVLKSPPVFIVGLLPLAATDPLGGAFSDLGTQTGGLYQTSDKNQDATTEAATLFKPEWASTKSTWKVTFTTDPAPGNRQPTETLAVHDAKNETGTTTLDYPSTGLFGKSGIAVKLGDGSDFVDGSILTSDETVTISVSGYSAWPDKYQLELYVDCGVVNDKVDLTGCPAPRLGDNGSSLPWQIPVQKMTQGNHYAVVRLVTKYDGADCGPNCVGPAKTIHFTRSGTTWNAAVVILVGGIAILLTGAFFIASRGRGAKRRKGATR